MSSLSMQSLNRLSHFETVRKCYPYKKNLDIDKNKIRQIFLYVQSYEISVGVLKGHILSQIVHVQSRFYLYDVSEV